MPALKEFLEGKPVRTPLHPAAVHLPIALFPLSVLLDIGSHVMDDGQTFVRAAFVALVAGLATALVAAVLGVVDYTDIRDDHPAKKTATAHLVLNLVAVGLFAASAGLRFSALHENRTPGAPFVLSVIAVVVLGYSGYLGGVLVYDDGIGVGRHRRRTRTPETTIVVRSKDEPVAVANASDLGERETLRVDHNGTIVTIARVDGTLHAFQEFCTHRYGPLSEGRLKGCEIECPWHGSRFDVRSGKVTSGPAKVDLRTFRVETRDGKIWLFPAV